MENSSDILSQKLKAYKKAFFRGILAEGLLLSVGILLSAFIIVSVLEYFGRFGITVRTVLFFSYVALVVFFLIGRIILPLYRFFNAERQLSDENAASQIGKYFPDIGDKLVNTVQLIKTAPSSGSLADEGIKQKSKSFTTVPFYKAVDRRKSRKYLKLALVPTILIPIILLFIPAVFSESALRLVKYNEEIIPAAPFQFVLTNNSLEAFKNEDFTIRLTVTGEALPEEVRLTADLRNAKMTETEPGSFEYTFKNLRNPTAFHFEASGFQSKEYQLKIVERPAFITLGARLDYPRYLNKKSENIINAGNITVPAGTAITWTMQTENTENVSAMYDSVKLAVAKKSDNAFEFNHRLMHSGSCDITLINNYSKNKSDIRYAVEVIPDTPPSVFVEQFRDTVLYDFIAVGGNISDDYGFSDLKLFYRKTSDAAEATFKSVNIPFSKKNTEQSFFLRWNLDSLALLPDEKIEYFVRVWDNDGVRGPKSRQSAVFVHEIPKEEDIKKETEKEDEKTEQQLENSVGKAKALEEKLNKLAEKLKTKQQIDWQDKKEMEKLLREHQKLAEDIEKFKEQNRLNSEKRDRYFEKNEELAQKAKQLQKLMDELLDEETKKLYEELERLTEDYKNSDAFREVLKKLSRKENSLEKDLERALEMFKQLKFDQKLNQAAADLEKTAEEQKELAEKSEERKPDTEAIKKEQESINKSFEEFKKDLDELEKIGEDLQNGGKEDIPREEEKKIEEELNESTEELKKDKPKKAADHQKKASEGMKELAKKLQEMQEEMSSQADMENIDALRAILENLLKLSFDQEELMVAYKEVDQSDPQYTVLSRKQITLKDDARMVEDSLRALAVRVPQIERVITKEVDLMNEYMDESTDAIKQRNPYIASGKQQFAMTSMNNLALMLGDVLQQMQQAAASAQPGAGGKSKSGLSGLQKQLNKKIEELKKSGKSGRALSEELAKLAAEQEAIRRALKEMEGGQKEGTDGINGKESLGNLGNKMEETEEDLVKKQLTRETIMRQKEILTRLLEAENAMRERGEEDEREAKTAKLTERKLPPALEKYIKEKENEAELLKTVPPALNPYYKKKANEYLETVD